MSHRIAAPATTPPQPGFRSFGRDTHPGGWRIPAPRRPERLAAPEPQAVSGAGRPISQRDLTLLRQLARGGSTAQIAVALSVSRNTARTRIRRVAAKLAVPDRRRLVLAARELGLT